MSEKGPRPGKAWKVVRRLRYGRPKQPADTTGAAGAAEAPQRGRRRGWGRGGGPERGRPDRGEPGGGTPEGGAGVREPRRPKPAPPTMSAEAEEPCEQFVDATSSST